MSDKKKTQEAILQNLPFMPYNPWSTQGLFTDSWMTGAWGYAGVNPYSLAARYDDGSGMLRPVYITTFQKKQITDSARELAFFNEYCSATIKVMQDYVVGTGFEYKVIPTREGVPESLLARAQDVVDLFCEKNRVFNLENEMVWRLLVEGEIITRLFYGDDGLITVRVVEPELLLPPNDSNDPDSSYGIQCKYDDIHDVVGYWIVERPWEGLTPILVPEDEVNFLKINSPSNAKRGLPMSFQVDQNFRQCESVLLAMVTLANARSKIAMVRKIDEAPPDAVEELQERTTDVILNDPVSNQRLNIERMPYGSILTASKNISYEFPEIGHFADEAHKTLQQNIRAICAHYGISEMQLSADAQTGTYASAIVAESPSHKNFVRWQKMIGDFMASRRAKPQQSIMWKQMIYAVEKGLLPSNALQDLKISYRGPSVVTRDQHEEAQSNKIYFDMGIKSADTIAAEQGLNYEDQRKHMMQDESLEAVLKAVDGIRKGGVGPDGGRLLLRKYFPTLPDEVVNALFTDEPAQKEPDAKEEEGGRPAAKVPSPPKP